MAALIHFPENVMMTNKQIKTLYQISYSRLDTVRAVIEDGREYPDAIWAVGQALGLKPDEIDDLEREYDECC